jgi:RNA polymerase sigma factor (sigma-70 family)
MLGLPMVRAIGTDEAVSAGMIALINCAEKYDVLRGTTFNTYLVPSIRGEIMKEAQRFAYRKFGGPKVWGGDIHKVPHPELSYMESHDGEIDHKAAMEKVHWAIEQLCPQMKLVIKLKYGLDGQPERNNAQIGALMGFSREWISKLHQQAIQILRDELGVQIE